MKKRLADTAISASQHGDKHSSFLQKRENINHYLKTNLHKNLRFLCRCNKKSSPTYLIDRLLPCSKHKMLYI